MEQVFAQYGIPGICVLLTIQILVRLGAFLWQLKEKKESQSEAHIKQLSELMQKNIEAIKQLESKLTQAQITLSEIPKLKMDLRRFYSAVKLLSGDRWTDIRKEIMEEELL